MSALEALRHIAEASNEMGDEGAASFVKARRRFLISAGASQRPTLRQDQQEHVARTIELLQRGPANLAISEAFTGAGKTLMSLATWKDLGAPICLVVAPSWEIVQHYANECRRFLPSVNIHMHENTSRHVRLMEALERVEIGSGSRLLICTTFSTLYRDLEALPAYFLFDQQTMVVVDEAHFLRNAFKHELNAAHAEGKQYTLVATMLNDRPFSLSPGSSLLLQSATPLPNGPQDLYWLWRKARSEDSAPAGRISQREGTALSEIQRHLVKFTGRQSCIPEFEFATVPLKQESKRAFERIQETYQKAMAKAMAAKGPQKRILMTVALGYRTQMRRAAFGDPEVTSHQTEEDEAERFERIRSGASQVEIYTQLSEEVKEVQKETRCPRTVVMCDFLDPLVGAATVLEDAGFEVCWLYRGFQRRSQGEILNGLQRWRTTDRPTVLMTTFAKGGTGIDMKEALSLVALGPPQTTAALVQAAGRICRPIAQEQMFPAPIRRVVRIVSSPEALLVKDLCKVDRDSTFVGNPILAAWREAWNSFGICSSTAAPRQQDRCRRCGRFISGPYAKSNPCMCLSPLTAGGDFGPRGSGRSPSSRAACPTIRGWNSPRPTPTTL